MYRMSLDLSAFLFRRYFFKEKNTILSISNTVHSKIWMYVNLFKFLHYLIFTITEYDSLYFWRMLRKLQKQPDWNLYALFIDWSKSRATETDRTEICTPCLTIGRNLHWPKKTQTAGNNQDDVGLKWCQIPIGDNLAVAFSLRTDVH